jgi:hypothetical protein
VTFSLTACSQRVRMLPTLSCAAATPRLRTRTSGSQPRVRGGGTSGKPSVARAHPAGSRTGTCTAASVRRVVSCVTRQTSAAVVRPARCARRVAACLGSA